MAYGLKPGWFSRAPSPAERLDAFAGVGERPLRVDLEATRTVDPDTGKVVHVGVVRAPEAALRLNLQPVATGAQAYFLVGLAGDGGQAVGATLSILDADKFPMRIGDRPGPVATPLLPKAVKQVGMASLRRSFAVLRRLGYQPPRLLADTKGSYALLQQKIFGPTFNDLFGDLQDDIGDVSVAGRGMFEQLVRAIQAVHAGGAVHCDVKPANLALLPADERGQGGRYFGLIDVGNSVDLADADTERPISRGSVPFEAPEQVQDELTYCMSEAVDVWAAAAVIVEFCAFATDLNPFLTPLNLSPEVEAQTLRVHHQAYAQWCGAQDQLAPLKEALVALIVSRSDPDAEVEAQQLLQEDLRQLTAAQWLQRGTPDSAQSPGRVPLERAPPEPDAVEVRVVSAEIARLAEHFPESYRDMVAFSYIFTRLELTDPELCTVVRACMNPTPRLRPSTQQLLALFDPSAPPAAGGLPCLALDEVSKQAFTACLAAKPLYTDAVVDRLETCRRIEDQHKLAGARRKLLKE